MSDKTTYYPKNRKIILNRAKKYYENKKINIKKASKKYRELSEKEKDAKQEYGKNRYQVMSTENKQRLRKYQGKLS